MVPFGALRYVKLEPYFWRRVNTNHWIPTSHDAYHSAVDSMQPSRAQMAFMCNNTAIAGRVAKQGPRIQSSITQHMKTDLTEPLSLDPHPIPDNNLAFKSPTRTNPSIPKLQHVLHFLRLKHPPRRWSPLRQPPNKRRQLERGFVCSYRSHW
jgi:hypothetical protein